MTYLLSTYWPWMLIALIFGGVVGFVTFLRSASGWWPDSWPGWFKLLCLLFLLGLVVAILKWLPGLAGHYLETALLLLGSYIVGCFLGSWLASFRATELKPQERPSSLAPAAPAPKPVTVTAPVAAAPAAALAGNDGHPGQRPSSIEKSAAPDNLKRISGIGHTNEIKLNELGIWTFRQIAEWTGANAEWVGSYLAFPGRIEREDWIGQAAQLAKGLETEFSRRVDDGDVPTSS
ncbi:hypothetical protein [Phyllobacterium sp. P30BS-XVII]|uniref:hypothetical protein n=1 Tax=Phyllobacterium sp. P30BS-XVII TaxID=2587046 RepID=UPI0017ADE133|nr:hypothetical protein [Phyllobacterium sp. P30BS-XVII]MBA8902306.1 putative flap endonuclease-1-like 5' DNA nuclease [Phyllobacterium sp. P30BS-XVII]